MRGGAVIKEIKVRTDNEGGGLRGAMHDGQGDTMKGTKQRSDSPDFTASHTAHNIRYTAQRSSIVRHISCVEI